MRKTFFFILYLMLSINIYKCDASHQVVDIIFSDGTKAQYSNKGLSFPDPVTLTDYFHDRNQIIIKGVQIDRSVPTEQIYLQLSQSPFVSQAILKNIEETPDEIFERELEDYCLTKLDKKGMPLREKIMLNRGLIKLIGEHAVLGSQKAKILLGISYSEFFVWLYKKSLKLDDIQEKIYVLKEANNVADTDLKMGGLYAKKNKQIVSFNLGLILVNHAQTLTVDALDEALKLIWEGIKYIEVAEKLDPTDKGVTGNLEQARLLWKELVDDSIYYEGGIQTHQTKKDFIEEGQFPPAKVLSSCVKDHKVEYVEEGIALTTNRSRTDYQLMSRPIPVKLHSSLKLFYKIELLEGGLGVGILSEDKSKFLVYQPHNKLGLIEGTLSLPFGSQEKNLYLIIANCRSAPEVSRSIIKNLVFTQQELSPAKALSSCVKDHKVAYVEDGIDLTTNRSRTDYQLMSRPIPISEASDLSLTFEADLKEGGFGVGILTEDQKKFLVYKVYRTLGLVKDTLRLPFGTSEKSVHLVFANNVAQPTVSRVVVKNHALTQAPLPPEKVLRSSVKDHKVEYQEGGIALTTNKSLTDYQLMSKPISISAASKLSLSFEVDLKEGGFGVGILTQDQKKFLIYKVYRTLGLVKDTLRLEAFKSQENVYLVFANNVAQPAESQFVIKDFVQTLNK